MMYLSATSSLRSALLLMMLFSGVRALTKSVLHRKYDNSNPNALFSQDKSKILTSMNFPNEDGTNASDTRFMASSNLIYKGGPLISNVKVILILWGGSANVRYAAELQKYYGAVTSSPWFDILSQYSTSTTTIGRGSLYSIYTYDNAPTGVLSIDTIDTALNYLIVTGQIPSPDANTYYAIHFAVGTRVAGECVANNDNTIYCFSLSLMLSDNDDDIVYYGTIPDQNTCGSCYSGSGLKDISKVASHGLASIVTDRYPSGWIDSNGNDVASKCGLDDVGTTVGSDGQTYYVSRIWSNAAGKCVTSASTVKDANLGLWTFMMVLGMSITTVYIF